ncbi:hypothetical protein [Kitasatospora cheerisanensis]|uniref:Uncharacterized protein n=1 Tax=Kitasatospora cheerisanensis KCTC 2395 TaxID=1348663 RepID=A0A066YR84_9ACTN|nr:hypothetical protein [Kitasatospora cheerisanensis]KDN82509.1 hypothetical protein KCH_56870 [Kitasatospora cheerisanensis KCTC 2395]
MPTPADRLAEARESSDPAALRALTATGYAFVDQALAVNPHTPPDALAVLAGARHSVWNDNCLLGLLAEHPAADGAVLHAVLAAVAERLAAGERPYTAALALARRPELPADGVRALGRTAGASARLRRRLARALDGRG